MIKTRIIFFIITSALFSMPAYAICQSSMAYDPESHQCVCPKDTINNRSLTNDRLHIGSCFHPMDLIEIQDLVLWLDAHYLDSITWDSSTLEVEEWRDRTANDNDVSDFTPLTTADRPSVVFGAKNDRHALAFLSTDKFLEGTIPTITGNSSFTIIIVKQHIDIAATNRTAISTGVTSDHFDVGTLSGSNFASHQSTGDNITTAGSESWHIHTTIRQAGSMNLYIDGLLSDTDSSNLLNLTGDYIVGQSVDTANRDAFRGYIGEIIIFDNAINDSLRDAIELYLSKKWSIILN